jgi:hypothetical protein
MENNLMNLVNLARQLDRGALGIWDMSVPFESGGASPRGSRSVSTGRKHSDRRSN